MKKIVVTGPESSGKTTLVKDIEANVDLHAVPEYARIYIDQLDRPYVKEDLEKIAMGQMESERSLRIKNNKILLCDTDLLTLKIWSEYKYGCCISYITEQLNKNLPDLYLLTSPDIPWEPDPQRENPLDRDEFFEIYRQQINALKVPYQIMKGDQTKRLDQFLKLIR